MIIPETYNVVKREYNKMRKNDEGIFELTNEKSVKYELHLDAVYENINTLEDLENAIINDLEGVANNYKEYQKKRKEKRETNERVF